jgi:hypothetical protein
VEKEARRLTFHDALGMDEDEASVDAIDAPAAPASVDKQRRRKGAGRSQPAPRSGCPEAA